MSDIFNIRSHFPSLILYSIARPSDVATQHLLSAHPFAELPFRVLDVNMNQTADYIRDCFVSTMELLAEY